MGNPREWARCGLCASLDSSPQGTPAPSTVQMSKWGLKVKHRASGRDVWGAQGLELKRPGARSPGLACVFPRMADAAVSRALPLGRVVQGVGRRKEAASWRQ